MSRCFPSDTKCEWAALRRFVEQFNATEGTAFRRAKCLDVEDSTQKLPEVLLQDDCGETMVIERKSIVWPPDFLAIHRSEHDFRRMVLEGLQSYSWPDLYVLEVNTRDLPRDKKQLRNIAHEITASISQWWNDSQTGRISRATPIPWSFSRVPENQRDEIGLKSGVGFIFYGDAPPYMCDPELFQREFVKASEELRKQLRSAEVKLQKFPESRRVVVLECYGELPLLDEDITRVVREYCETSSINQVWLAVEEGVSEWQWEYAYERIWRR